MENPNLKMSFADYKKQVEECLMKNEGLTTEEAKAYLMTTWDPPLANGARTAEEELSICYERGRPPATAAAVLLV